VVGEFARQEITFLSGGSVKANDDGSYTITGSTLDSIDITTSWASETITTTPEQKTVHALGGDDLIHSENMQDGGFVYAGSGDDTVFNGQAGNTVVTGDGNDNVYVDGSGTEDVAIVNGVGANMMLQTALRYR
jgi:hypothetical protein